jgi:high-affinity iron transporter
MCCRPSALGPRALCAAVLLLACSARAAVSDGAPAADVRRSLTLLNVVGEEYREGVVDGQVVLPIEYGEARAFLEEARGRLSGAAPDVATATAGQFAQARASIDAKAPTDQVRGQLEALRAEVSTRTGISEPVFPDQPASAARGRALFTDHCAPCHGTAADGRGPAAAALKPPPANFGDAAFMRGETPFDFFHVITLGRPTGAMPAWGDVLSLQDRWDLVSYLWTVAGSPAHFAEGQGVYLSACAGCHGATGDGRGPLASTLPAPLAPLDDPATVSRASDADLARVVADGKPGTAMPGFAGRLSAAQIDAAAAYVRRLSLGGEDGTKTVTADGEATRFAGLLTLLAGEYQKAVPAGGAVGEQEMLETGILLEQVQRQAPRLQSALAQRDPAAADQLAAAVAETSDAIARRAPAVDVVAATGRAKQLVEAHFPTAGAAAAASAPDALVQAQALLDKALAAYRAGDPRAVYSVSDAYFLFDPLEQTLSLSNAALVRSIEGRFTELRGVMAQPGREADAAGLVTAMKADLETVRTAAAPRDSGANLAFQSAFIILREGFEVVLIVGALLAYATRSGSKAMRPPILWGGAAGIVASLCTAWVFVEIFEATGAAGEVLEGATMLLAAAVLFFVSYWLISKAEAERWQRYIQGKVKAAVDTGNLFALAGAAFLAVYREGVETVLFYKALLDGAGSQAGAVVLGFGVGVAGLVVVYILYQRLGRRLPLRQFFLVTGGLLYYLAVVFAGKGVAALQSAGVVRTTLVPWVPRIDALGVYPTAESLAAQAVLIFCAVYAAFIAMRPSAPAEAGIEDRAARGAKL